MKILIKTPKLKNLIMKITNFNVNNNNKKIKI